MKYGVRLEGRNFELNTDHGAENFGFVATRFVKAKSPEEAEQVAVRLVKNDENLVSAMTSNTNREPMIYLIECWQESWWKKLGGKVYTFFPMKTESE